MEVSRGCILLTDSVGVPACLCGWRRCLCGGVGVPAPVCGSGAVSHRVSGGCAEWLSRCVDRGLRGTCWGAPRCPRCVDRAGVSSWG